MLLVECLKTIQPANLLTVSQSTHDNKPSTFDLQLSLVANRRNLPDLPAQL